MKKLRTFSTAIILIINFSLLVYLNPQDFCITNNNTYWTGYRCACKVGYKNQSNNCVPLNLIKTQYWVTRQPVIISTDINFNHYQQQNQNNQTTSNNIVLNNNCYLPYQYFNGKQCICLEGFQRVNMLCQPINNNSNNNSILCPSNSYKIGNQCVCKDGYLKINGYCIQNSQNNCGSNSYNNGLGFCVCMNGYYKLNDVCVLGSPCPPFSTRNSNGQCICDLGLTKFNDYCSKCPLGAIFDSLTQRCVYVCGNNAIFNNSLQKCQCIQGYGIYQQVCTICPVSYFVQNNYCVSCPINSIYNTHSKKCVCEQSYLLGSSGFCIKKCLNQNQIYNIKTGFCECLSGLGRVNRVCQLCQNNSVPSLLFNQSCIACGINQIACNGKCICKNGYINNQFGICLPCNQVSGAFYINNLCAKCPGSLVNINQQCTCPLGKIKLGIQCKQVCKQDQLIDENGLCYRCPIYQIIFQGKCVCKPNYLRNITTGQCQLKCNSNQFIYKGRCGQCPLNFVYRFQINGCSCPDGQYINSKGVCQSVIIKPIECQSGFYLDKMSGCLPCSNGCKTCTSANVCISCAKSGFSVFNGICQQNCGDGIIGQGQQCDDKNKNNGDGCTSTCKIQNSWSCSGQPSICQYNNIRTPICGNKILQTGQQCDDGNLINGDGCSSKCLIETTNTIKALSIVGNPSTNINNVFVVLKTAKTYAFSNQNIMQNFIKAKFPDSNIVPSVYCSQRQVPELEMFDCLIIYSSGIPNRLFNIQFSYNYQGQQGSVTVPINPLVSSPVRSRK